MFGYLGDSVGSWLPTDFSRNPYAPGSDLPGALGRGQAVASALGNFFKFWAYASTVIGAVVAGMSILHC